MNKSAISSIATEVHELDVQLTKCVHLDIWMKTLPLDSSNAVASEVTTQTDMGSESMTQTDCLVQQQTTII